MQKSKYLSPRLLTLISMDFTLYFRKKGNYVFFLVIPFICGVLLRVSTSADTFGSYDSALPIVFALSCTAILLGLVLSINMVCKDFPIIHRKLRKGLPAAYVILSKTFLILVLCFIMAIVLTATYLSTLKTEGMDASGYISFYLSIFFTMIASAEMGLLVSTLPKITADLASMAVSFIISFQILCSGHLPGIDSRVNEGLSIISFSRYSITLLGGTVGVVSSRFANTFSEMLESFGWLTGFYVIFILFSCLVLMFINTD